MKELQALPLERKIQITQTRIIEWYQHYKGQVCVSFSGGKDSTVLLHIARQIYPDIPAVFSNTGLEYSSIQRFVKTGDNVDIVVPKMNFVQVVSTYGYPLIGKEVAEAIYYARRLSSQNGHVERERERDRRKILGRRKELLGRRTTLSRQAERETEERYCKADGERTRKQANRTGGADSVLADGVAQDRTPRGADAVKDKSGRKSHPSRDRKWGDYHRRTLAPNENDPRDKDCFWNKPKQTEWSDWRMG